MYITNNVKTGIILIFLVFCISGCNNYSLFFKNNHKLKVILTFDDSTEDHYSSAFEIMKKYNVRGTFYIITDLIGQSGRLTLNQLSEMSRYGNEIASHSATHPIFTSINESTIRNELSKSKEYLEANGFFTGSFAYPGHRRNDFTNSIVFQYFPYIRPFLHQGTEILRDDVNRMINYINGVLSSGGKDTSIFVNIHLVKPSDYPSSPYVVHEEKFEYFITELLNMDVDIITSQECFEIR